ncbi:acetoacetate decarboxylase [Legionella israelensis]|uniref:Acetoacetate decarboxylase n=1 Tax=Legionella israelensis TaxID=454 RepID=A0A0W0WI24_9GAMM|nr:acetoacetate decarboxylase [Legionella israelensis]KTD32009.1 acetoacetate decarboxylase [Legionella israelensis]QBS10096.1 acetoacetate decarboxylase [Legionella israelensis]QDP71092.1 acetoacetate decarboxylase [Legionella israelensis]SCX97039.1 acetoacetate decarboxylase [Legionella israelensis DSM 19235]STX59681.1 acetoacetate decarboxylase [Legionella israelensis]
MDKKLAATKKYSFVNEFDMPAPRWIRTYPAGPYRFINREFFIISYETDPDILESILPPHLELLEPVVKYEFIRMPDSTGFGDYTETGQVIPVKYKGEEGTFTISMFLDCHAPIAGGREIWGFPKKLAKPKLFVEEDALIGILDYGSTRLATATMGYKHHKLDEEQVLQSLKKPIFLLKNIPGVDGKPEINQLTRTYLSDINVKGAWTGPGSLELHPHALAPISDLYIKKIVSVAHFVTDLTLPYGEVVEDYLKKK